MKLHLLAQNLEKQLLEIEENSETIMQRSKHSIIGLADFHSTFNL